MPKRKNISKKVEPLPEIEEEDSRNEDTKLNMDVDDESAKEAEMKTPEAKSEKQKVYAIFNEIQTLSNIKENLNKLCTIYEKVNAQAFIEALQNVFAMMMKSYDKNTITIKNIRNFVRNFLEKVTKSQKLKKKNSTFINSFLRLLTRVKGKVKCRALSTYFLQAFLVPYAEGDVLLYSGDALNDVKIYITNILNGKQQQLISGVLQLLQKIPALVKDEKIFEKLEALLAGANKGVKKEIIRLFEDARDDIAKYLVKMFDDESADIRLFTFEKLAKIDSFSMLPGKVKVRIFFVGLCDPNEKVQNYAKKILKKYMRTLGILKKGSKNAVNDGANFISEEQNCDEKMDLESQESRLDRKSEDSSSLNLLRSTAKEKVSRHNTPLKPSSKLADSPSRIFDELEVAEYYNHPVYSFVYPAITESVLEFVEKGDMLDYCKSIVENLLSILNSPGDPQEKAMESFTNKKRRTASSFSQMSGSKVKINNGCGVEKFALFNDLFFFQNVLSVLSQQRHNETFKNDVADLLPDEIRFCELLQFFYIHHANILILHQLFILTQYMNFQDEIGNKKFAEFLRTFISDISLYNKKISDKKLTVHRRQLLTDADSEVSEDSFAVPSESVDESRETEIVVNNYLLTANRKIITSMEDLVEFALRIYRKIDRSDQRQLFQDVITVVDELRDTIVDESQRIKDDDDDEERQPNIKKHLEELIEKSKEKIGIIDQLNEDLRKDNSDKISLNLKIKQETEKLEKLDAEIQKYTNMEECTLYRINILCKFLINNCSQLPFAQFNDMVQKYLIPALKKTQFARVIESGLENTGILSIIYYNSVFKNFLKLFFDNVDRDDTIKFSNITRISLSILLDSYLCNNLVDFPENLINGKAADKINGIIDKYLYSSDHNARLMTFIGVCKLLLAEKFSSPEFLISRLLVALYRSTVFDDKDTRNYNVKISEIMNNFMYFYSLQGQTHINNIVKAVNLVLTSRFFFQNDMNFSRNLLAQYNRTRYDFLNKFLFVVYKNAEKKLKHAAYVKVVFKVFKYCYFCYKYVSEDSLQSKRNNFALTYNKKNTNLQNLDAKNVATAKSKYDLNKIANEDDKIANEEQQSALLKTAVNAKIEAQSREKSINFSLKLHEIIKNNVPSLIDKHNIDEAVFNYFENSDEFGKFLSLLTNLDDLNLLENFSKFLHERYQEYKDKNFLVEINGNLRDYNSEENRQKLAEYFARKEEKYYNLIENNFAYCVGLKNVRILDSKKSSIQKILAKVENSEDDDESLSENEPKEEDILKDISDDEFLDKSASDIDRKNAKDNGLKNVKVEKKKRGRKKKVSDSEEAEEEEEVPVRKKSKNKKEKSKSIPKKTRGRAVKPQKKFSETNKRDRKKK